MISSRYLHFLLNKLVNVCLQDFFYLFKVKSQINIHRSVKTNQQQEEHNSFPLEYVKIKSVLVHAKALYHHKLYMRTT